MSGRRQSDYTWTDYKNSDGTWRATYCHDTETFFCAVPAEYEARVMLLALYDGAPIMQLGEQMFTSPEMVLELAGNHPVVAASIERIREEIRNG